ncbi:TetR/AcrR family transcriptional regulator [Halopseudomonas salegens]|uniref:Transcriptional regulator, TetR family n=1 Tax=Halopseudomonas salegens TaxID=1434072 RepID=A0A1H2F4D1_9GAMM|nr:TetR/AcrR family transcriptional regulator [Halopseudomonas salegens]SDU02189.1 transcriptional regulator, TetR family [Halopseudomonas salegens]
MPKPSSHPRPGRPVDPEKIERILDHALQSIAEGDLQFGMESVARRAGVAKSTLYRHFDNADGLLKAVLERQHRALVGNGPEPFSSLEGLREQLLNLGHQLLDFLASEEGIKIMRAVIAHGARHGAHGQMIYQDGPIAFVRRAEECLRHAVEQGQISVDDPAMAAEQLVGMWKGCMLNGLLMNGRPLPDQAERQLRIESAVDLFLRATTRLPAQ